MDVLQKSTLIIFVCDENPLPNGNKCQLFYKAHLSIE